MKNPKHMMSFIVGVVFVVAMLMGARTTDAVGPVDTLTVAMGTLGYQTYLPWQGCGPCSTYLNLIYDFLVYLEPKTDNILPGLATKWEMSDGWKNLDFLAS